ncbi:Nucleotidyltransferase domain protein [uncultured archaeon]|nr:Nucleotidyltransferase domain protein [uncultured archaeon]
MQCKILNRVKEKREDVLRIAAAHGASNVRVFGSVARGEDGPESDLDLLVEMKPGSILLDLVSLWQDLEDLLGHRVDVITEGGISPYLRDRIHAEAVPL